MSSRDDISSTSQDDDEAELWFALHLMKFAYRICNVKMPTSVQRQLEVLDMDFSLLFTESMQDAIRTNVNKMCEYDMLPPKIGSHEYNEEVLALQNCYTDDGFFNFICRYAPSAAFEEIGIIGALLRNDIVGILKSKAPIRESWIKFHEAAKVIVANENGVLSNKIATQEADLKEEREFCLRFIHYVSQLHFKSLPQCLELQILNLDTPQETDPFTNNVAHAIAIVLNNHVDVRKQIGKKGLEDYSLDSVSQKFIPREFFEFCVCYSCKALFAFVDELNDEAAVYNFETMVVVLDYAKKVKEFSSWDVIENIAIQLIEEDAQRTESENEKLKIFKQYESQVNVEDDIEKTLEKLLNTLEDILEDDENELIKNVDDESENK